MRPQTMYSGSANRKEKIQKRDKVWNAVQKWKKREEAAAKQKAAAAA